jgi:uncharacterized protein YndB with AHSA1/START domain
MFNQPVDNLRPDHIFNQTVDVFSGLCFLSPAPYPIMTMPSSSTDRIEKSVVLDAPRHRVWRAITDVAQFNQWFGVNLESPFTPSAVVKGNMTYPGYEHLVMTIWIDRIEPERLFSFRWHPYAIDPDQNYDNEPTTLVTFTLEDASARTKLTIVESGFDAIPESRRQKAFTSNSDGWAGQLENIAAFLRKSAA